MEVQATANISSFQSCHVFSGRAGIFPGCWESVYDRTRVVQNLKLLKRHKIKFSILSGLGGLRKLWASVWELLVRKPGQAQSGWTWQLSIWTEVWRVLLWVTSMSIWQDWGCCHKIMWMLSFWRCCY